MIDRPVERFEENGDAGALGPSGTFAEQADHVVERFGFRDRRRGITGRDDEALAAQPQGDIG